VQGAGPWRQQLSHFIAVRRKKNNSPPPRAPGLQSWHRSAEGSRHVDLPSVQAPSAPRGGRGGFCTTPRHNVLADECLEIPRRTALHAPTPALVYLNTQPGPGAKLVHLIFPSGPSPLPLRPPVYLLLAGKTQGGVASLMPGP